MYVCIYKYIYIYIYTYVHIHIHEYVMLCYAMVPVALQGEV